MFARVHTIDATGEQYERGFEIVRDELLPWARESTGFCGLIGLVDRTRGETLVLTLWETEEALDRGAEAGERLSRLAATASGATLRSLDSYEVSLFDVPESARETFLRSPAAAPDR